MVTVQTFAVMFITEETSLYIIMPDLLLHVPLAFYQENKFRLFTVEMSHYIQTVFLVVPLPVSEVMCFATKTQN
jgi:hypothetical protein